MSWFHQLSDGRSWRPPKSSVRTAELLESDGRGADAVGTAASGEADGADGVPPHAAPSATTGTRHHIRRRMFPKRRQEPDQLVRSRERNLFPRGRFTRSDGTVTDETLM